MYIIYSIILTKEIALPILDDNGDTRIFNQASDVAEYLDVAATSVTRAVNNYNTIRCCKIRRYRLYDPLISKTLPMSDYKIMPRYAVYDSGGNCMLGTNRHIGITGSKALSIAKIRSSRVWDILYYGKPVKCGDVYILQVSVGFVPDSIITDDVMVFRRYEPTEVM